MSNIKYPVGTRYSNSSTGDEATAEILHGYQVFQQAQCRPDGTLTGRKSFINEHGVLCGIELAEGARNAAIHNAAPKMLEALLYDRDRNTGAEHGLSVYQRMRDEAIAKALGVTA